MNLRLLGTAGLVAAITLTACGSNGGGALSKADFATQGNAICTASHAKLKALTQPKSAADLSTYLSSAATIVSGSVEAIAALKAPSEYASDAAKLVSDGRAEVAAVNAAAAQAKSGDTQGALTAMEKVGATDQADNELATKIGLTECAASN
jgi:hypothetical protein